MADEKRLIDAYRLEDLVRSNSARYHHVDDVIAAIAGQPTVDAVEVVHARWEQIGYDVAMDRITCSHCKENWNIIDNCVEDFNYCPNCGAKMDLKENNYGYWI